MILMKLLMALRGAFTRRYLASHTDYSYTADFLSDQLPNWQIYLAPLAQRVGCQVLEIGSHEGRSAVWFLHNLCRDNHSRITCIDTFHGQSYEARFDHNTRIAGGQGRLTKCKGSSHDWLPTLTPASFDLIYVDGSHLAADVVLDGLLCWKLLKRGGLLLFDDYLWNPHRKPSRRPQMGIDLLLETWNEQARVLFQEYQVLVQKLSDGPTTTPPTPRLPPTTTASG